jgi:hypothetical protein
MSIRSMQTFWDKATALGLNEYGIMCTLDGLGFEPTVPEDKQNEAWAVFHEVEAEEAAEPQPKEQPA